MAQTAERVEQAATRVRDEAAAFAALIGMVTWAALGLAVLGFTALAAFCVAGILRPVDTIRQAMERLQGDRRGHRHPVHGAA